MSRVDWIDSKGRRQAAAMRSERVSLGLYLADVEAAIDRPRDVEVVRAIGAVALRQAEVKRAALELARKHRRV